MPEELAQLMLHIPLLEEPTPHPSAEGLRCPHLPDRHHRGRACGIKSKERLRALALPAFYPRERIGWREVQNLELRESVAETRREPGAPLEGALALNTPASWEPIRNATRVGEDGEDLVDRSADAVDERVANRAHKTHSASACGRCHRTFTVADMMARPWTEQKYVKAPAVAQSMGKLHRPEGAVPVYI
jgi:hypothetical protein